MCHLSWLLIIKALISQHVFKQEGQRTACDDTHGTEDTLMPTVINLANIWIAMLSLAACLVPIYDLRGVWRTMAVKLTLCGSLFLYRLFKRQMARKESRKVILWFLFHLFWLYHLLEYSLYSYYFSCAFIHSMDFMLLSGKRQWADTGVIITVLGAFIALTAAVTDVGGQVLSLYPKE